MNDRKTVTGDRLTEKIIGAAIEFHKNLGPGLLESIYEEAICVEFEIRGLGFSRQVGIDVVYKGRTIKGQRIDIVVEGEVIIEIKSLSRMPEVVMAQILSYLKATRLKRGLMINFGEKRLADGIKRVSN
jgi:GxxExxY protein